MNFMAEQAKKTNNIMYLHYAVVLLLCFGFKYLPPIGALTPLGMAIAGNFIGCIYGWSLVNMLWPSLVALLSMGLTIGMDTLVAQAFGNQTVMVLIFMTVVMAVTTETGAMDWLVGKLLGAKFTAGKPWLTIWFLLLVAYVAGNFNSVIMALVMCTVLNSVFKQLGVEPYSKLPVLMFLGLAFCLMLGQVTFPFLGVGLVLVSAYSAMFQTALDFGQYIMFALPVGLIMTIVYTMIMRFVMRVDVTPFKNYDPSMTKVDGKGGKATRDQKLALFFFFLYCLLVLFSSVRQFGILYAVCSKFGMYGLCTATIIIMTLLPKEDGSPLLEFNKLAKHMSWDIVVLTAFIMVLSTLMSSPDAGISATFNMLLQPLTQLSPYVFIVSILAFGCFVTNFANNLVLTILLMPMVVQFSAMVGMQPLGVICLLFFACQMALGTPGGSPVTAIMFAQSEWVKPGAMMKNAFIMLPMLFVAMVALGLGWASILF